MIFLSSRRAFGMLCLFCVSASSSLLVLTWSVIVSAFSPSWEGTYRVNSFLVKQIAEENPRPFYYNAAQQDNESSSHDYYTAQLRLTDCTIQYIPKNGSLPRKVKTPFDNETLYGDCFLLSVNIKICNSMGAVLCIRQKPVQESNASGTTVFCIRGVTGVSTTEMRSSDPTERTLEEVLRYRLTDIETMRIIHIPEKNQTTVILDDGDAKTRNVRLGLVKISAPTEGERMPKQNETRGSMRA